MGNFNNIFVSVFIKISVIARTIKLTMLSFSGFLEEEAEAEGSESTSA